MVVLSKIYTKTGDAGETALGNGARVAKHSARVSAYGTVDETNATVGLARLHANGEMDAALQRISNDLFDLGADLCTPDMYKDAEAAYPPLRMIAAQVARLESEIDAMNARLTPLRSFIPRRFGACRAAAPVPHRLSPRRTAGGGIGHNGRGQRRSGEIPEPAVGLVLRGGAHRQQ
jgi:ATP:cob(I)alamin adenosyltransferase